MSKSFYIFTLCLVLFCANVFGFGKLRAVDGDSVKGAKGVHLRLLCIDAPELKQRGGRSAQQALQRHLDKGIDIRTRGRDQHGRRLVLLAHRDGSIVNLALVNEGHAWVSRRHARDCGLPVAELYAAEKSARHARRGLWQQGNPLPPWHWRRNNPR